MIPTKMHHPPQHEERSLAAISNPQSWQDAMSSLDAELPWHLTQPLKSGE